ncbi:MAG: hypothetical protein ACTSQI_17845, partial [Candidatus Helarchaeota archaeon]
MLSDKILLLTGASSGIGTVLLEHFIGRMQYIITSNRADLSEFLNLKPKPSNLDHIPLDLTIEANCQKLFRYITD